MRSKKMLKSFPLSSLSVKTSKILRNIFDYNNHTKQANNYLVKDLNVVGKIKNQQKCLKMAFERWYYQHQFLVIQTQI
jgi:hypothetical protein